MKKIFFLMLFSLTIKSSQEILFQLPAEKDLQSLLEKNGYSFFAEKQDIKPLFNLKINKTVSIDMKAFAFLFIRERGNYLGEREEIFFPFNSAEIPIYKNKSYFSLAVEGVLPYLKQNQDHLFFDIPEDQIKIIFWRATINIPGELGEKTLSLDKIKHILLRNIIPYNVISFFGGRKPITPAEEQNILKMILQSAQSTLQASL